MHRLGRLLQDDSLLAAGTVGARLQVVEGVGVFGESRLIFPALRPLAVLPALLVLPVDQLHLLLGAQEYIRLLQAWMLEVAFRQ